MNLCNKGTVLPIFLYIFFSMFLFFRLQAKNHINKFFSNVHVFSSYKFSRVLSAVFLTENKYPSICGCADFFTGSGTIEEVVAFASSFFFTRSRFFSSA